MATKSEMLENVKTAIDDITLNGQAVTWANGVSYTKADLGQLRALRKELEAEVADESSSNSFFSRSRTIIPRRG